ncbi:MAG: PEP-CTERM sorting domain-containing protein [Verrucomicrobiota bacterium]
MKRLAFLASVAVLPLSSKAAVIDYSFDAQPFDLILGTPTTGAGYLPYNGLLSAPVGFNTFSPHASASVTESGVTLQITNILGSWPGNNAGAIGVDAVRADYFVIQTGQTATLQFSGLDPNELYSITFVHGNAEPTQPRAIDVVGVGGPSDIDNGSTGTPEATFEFTANGSGEISVGLTGLGAQEGDLAGVRITGGVPEPSALMLGVLGLGLMSARRRR